MKKYIVDVTISKTFDVIAENKYDVEEQLLKTYNRDFTPYGLTIGTTTYCPYKITSIVESGQVYSIGDYVYLHSAGFSYTGSHMLEIFDKGEEYKDKHSYETPNIGEYVIIDISKDKGTIYYFIKGVRVIVYVVDGNAIDLIEWSK